MGLAAPDDRCGHGRAPRPDQRRSSGAGRSRAIRAGLSRAGAASAPDGWRAGISARRGGRRGERGVMWGSLLVAGGPALGGAVLVALVASALTHGPLRRR